ncbi:MAG: hypothetical protein ACJAVI_003534 [Candidatus Azotimanducaceae bacterium]|jgi:hypothetical protein
MACLTENLAPYQIRKQSSYLTIKLQTLPIRHKILENALKSLMTLHLLLRIKNFNYVSKCLNIHTQGTLIHHSRYLKE